jgi:hypothetical protein
VNTGDFDKKAKHFFSFVLTANELIYIPGGNRAKGLAINIPQALGWSLANSFASPGGAKQR